MKKLKRKLIACVMALVLIMSDFSIVSAADITMIQGLSASQVSLATTMLYNKFGVAEAARTLPGIKQTVTMKDNLILPDTIETCGSMATQAITTAVNGKYILITAYCSKGCSKNHNAVIYVIEAATHTYKTTLILDKDMHAGGIVCTSDYIWICDYYGKKIKLYSISEMVAAANAKLAYKCIKPVKENKVSYNPSYMSYFAGKLYIGSFYEDGSTTSPINIYNVSGSSMTYTGKFYIEGISYIQGISVSSGYMVVSSSYGRHNKSKMYVFKDSTNYFTKPEIHYYKEGLYWVKTIKLPNMLQACFLNTSRVYLVFESACSYYLNATKSGEDLKKYPLRPYDKYSIYKRSLFV